MNELLQTALGRFRAVSAIEGISYALLVFVAMPLKYGMGIPEAVRVVGMAHGLLFIAFVATLWQAREEQRWELGRAGLLFGLSLIPLGAIAIERSCRTEDATAASA